MVSKVLVLGATGMVGSHLVNLLVADPSITAVTVLSRRPIEKIHAKVDVKVVDFNNFDDYRNKFGSGDAIFCCIGTTMGQVKGNKDLYRSIDYDIPVNAGKIGLEKGFRQYAIVSSIGANAASGNFYLKLKGQVEENLSMLNFPSLHIFQPSLLIGNRNESRTGEGIAQVIMPALSPIMIGGLKRYRPIPGSSVASAMFHVVKNEVKGSHRYTFKEIMQLA